MRIVVLALAALSAAGAAWGAPNDREFYTGELLYQRCAAQDAGLHAACRAYILGVSDALQAGQGAAPLAGTARPAAICLSSDASPEMIAERVAAFLDIHTEMRKFAAADLVYLALKDAYPCR